MTASATAHVYYSSYLFTSAYVVLANVSLSEGDPGEAIRQYERVLSFNDQSDLSGLVRAYAAAGRKEEARRLLGEIILHSGERYASSIDLARAYFAIGEDDSAFVHIEKALDERNPALFILRYDPADAPIAADPRFESITKRMGLDLE